VIGSRAKLSACLAAVGLAVALVLPTAATAHQRATLSGGVLTITGDHPLGDIPKPNDLVTIDFDASANEFIFGQDVFGPHPPECSPDAEHPQRIIHCPASLIDSIVIQSGIGSDEVDANLQAGSSILQVSTGPEGDAFNGGPEKDRVNLGSGGDKADGGAGSDRIKGGSGTDKLLGGPGADALFGGTSPDKILGGPGNDHCNPGPGTGKEISC
jgi:serralysin